jgi:hypothetical protein
MGHYKVSGIIKVPILSAFLDFMVLVCSAFDEVGNKETNLVATQDCSVTIRLTHKLDCFKFRTIKQLP